MKTLFSLLILIFFTSSAAFTQGIGINETGTAAHNAAILDVSSTKKGFLPPRMTTAQRDSIANPADGLVIFNLTAGCLNYFFGGSWYEGKAKITYPSGTVHCNVNPTAVVEVLNPATGKTWMDRNLGAGRVATSSTDSSSYGDLYQWGRRADGHQCRNSITTNILSSTDQPDHGNFITASSDNYDWRNPQNNQLWQGVNGINNPCPSGYRIPTEAELNEERLSWNSQDAVGAFASPLKLPMAGRRSGDDGSVSYAGNDGYYYSSTVNETAVQSLLFNSNSAGLLNVSRSLGYTVRCIKHTPPIEGVIQTLGCSTASSTGMLTQGVAANGVSAKVPYTGGNGGTHSGQTVASAGVTGLTATLTAGVFANGADSLIYNITGTPASSGTASFALNIGGQSCTLTVMVAPAGPAYPAGTVHCTPTPTAVVEVVNPSTGKTWMDRNLGATRAATTRTDEAAYGDLYQWGRRADGHQCRNSPATTILSSTDQPPHGDFIMKDGGNNDWRDPQNNSLWQGVNGINNPCPSGFRLPTIAEYNAERASWSSNNAFGAFGSPLKFTTAGYRASNAILQNVNSTGYYWANSSNINAHYLSFDGSFAFSVETYRVFGFSVRCIKEFIPLQGVIQTLDCNSVPPAGTLTQGVAASGVSAKLPYTGGNGGIHAGQIIGSTGVAGLTATLAAGTFSIGSDTLVYTITGTPASSGTASFALNIGGQTCTLTRLVAPPGPAYPAGTVHCTPTPTAVVDVINPATGKTWMDRNLGASRLATSRTDTAAFGDLYQWGRRADGHQCRNSANTTTLSSSDQPPNSSFIVAPSGLFDWRNPQNDNLWQGINGVNNPCPSGYRMPTDAEFFEEHQSWASQSSVGAFASPLKLPAAGSRDHNNGSLSQGESFNYYWSSSAYEGDAWFLTFHNFSDGSALVLSAPRAYGFSVRCIKDTAFQAGSVQTLACNTATSTGTLKQGEAAAGVSSKIPYTGGNGGTHTGQTVASTGVTGLTATLTAGAFANGADSLVFNITGTPANSGTASFALNIGGQTCSLTRSVAASGAAYPAGTVHCTPTPTAVVDVTNPATGKTWMDRNLGASRVATSSTDANAYGDLYQWGRRADGHQCRNSTTTNIQSTTDQPPHGFYVLPPSLAPPDWRNPENSNLWQGVSGINNPCPIGYRVPTIAELDAERASWGSQNTDGAFGSSLKLSEAGYRNFYSDASITGFSGFYHSSTISFSRPQRLSFSGGSAQMFGGDRAMGGTVRCIKESSYLPGTINALQCNNVALTGFLAQGIIASWVSISVPYTGGNAGSHSGQLVASTGVTGLTATLYAGAFANGSGSLTYLITGTPVSNGIAGFALNIGGQTCTATIAVSASTAPYPAGTVHCSTPTAVVDVLNPATGRTWMDRNLGASRKATSSNDTAAYGDLYQWGRRADGHQCRNSQTTIVFSSIDQPPHGDFIQTTTSPNDWRIPQNNQLWQGENGINNPCPQGYRVPTETELNDEYKSWSVQSALGAFFSPLQLPMAGGRSNSGAPPDGGSAGFYWTSKAGGTNASYLYFSNNFVFMNGNSRGYAYSVRCIKN